MCERRFDTQAELLEHLRDEHAEDGLEDATVR
jgi:hypothetical protein